MDVLFILFILTIFNAIKITIGQDPSGQYQTYGSNMVAPQGYPQNDGTYGMPAGMPQYDPTGLNAGVKLQQGGYQDPSIMQNMGVYPPGQFGPNNLPNYQNYGQPNYQSYGQQLPSMFYGQPPPQYAMPNNGYLPFTNNNPQYLQPNAAQSYGQSYGQQLYGQQPYGQPFQQNYGVPYGQQPVG
uniref:Uncharacterized protein n=2 Tax=Meloidogyne TaxID=189290 RepID=A0A915PDM3_9BILA